MNAIRCVFPIMIKKHACKILCLTWCVVNSFGFKLNSIEIYPIRWIFGYKEYYEGQLAKIFLF
jgi:hypothetical protein